MNWEFNPSPIETVLTIKADGEIEINEDAAPHKLVTVLHTLAAMYYKQVVWPEQMKKRMEGR